MCDSCEVLNINGRNCHEIGCPDVWLDYPIECAWCDRKFMPEFKGQKCCDNDCHCLYASY
ncbi:hypothetical protein LCGC14_0873400 [marine sediment metagenome]|uniref:Uncharacterized protein n=1 Tax=marine sediment metagenome TaxID=412755 RepID=A0A0F9PPQ4_9ZZZZ